MVSALELSILEWRPSSLRDIDDLPHQVVEDYWSIRAGEAAKAEPWGWYRTGDPLVATNAHLFRHGPDGPEVMARCGVERIEGAEYRREATAPLCIRCDAISKGKPTREGTIGDLMEEELRLAGDR